MKLPDWRGRTVVCIASGPSLTPQDCALVRAAGLPTIVTNLTFRRCLWADVLFGFDPPWWTQHLAEVRATFAGRLFTQSLHPKKGVECARQSPRFKSFCNAGTDAISLAVAAGASRVVMVGYDCALTGGQAHHHPDYVGLRNCDTLPLWPARFTRLAEWSGRRSVVVNASRESALTCFPRVVLEHELLDGSCHVARADGGRLGLGAVDVAGGGG